MNCYKFFILFIIHTNKKNIPQGIALIQMTRLISIFVDFNLLLYNILYAHIFFLPNTPLLSLYFLQKKKLYPTNILKSHHQFI